MSTVDQQRAAAIMHNALTLTTCLTAAIIAMHEAMGGYPTQVAGASVQPSLPHQLDPDTDHDPDDDGVARRPASLTERTALEPDPARRALADLEDALVRADDALAHAARLAQRWGRPHLGGATGVRERIVAADAGIWCTNHLRHGFREPRAEGRTVCEFCAHFASDWKRDAPKEILDHKSRRRLYETDIVRILGRLDAEAKAARKARRKGGAR